MCCRLILKREISPIPLLLWCRTGRQKQARAVRRAVRKAVRRAARKAARRATEKAGRPVRKAARRVTEKAGRPVRKTVRRATEKDRRTAGGAGKAEEIGKVRRTVKDENIQL